MIDRVTPTARLAAHRPRVCHEAPDWPKEVLVVFVLLLAIALVAALTRLGRVTDELTEARLDLDFWREVALAPLPPRRDAPTHQAKGEP